MENNRYDHKDTGSALQLKALIMLSDDKIQSIERKEKHLNRVVCIYNTIDLLAAMERRLRKRRNTDAMTRQQRENPSKTPRLGGATTEEEDVFKEEVDELFKDLLTPPSNL